MTDSKHNSINDDAVVNRVPVLIIPGFMSSGLVCKKSGVGKKFEGKRVWVNVGQLGFSALHCDGALVANEKKRGLNVPLDGTTLYNPVLHSLFVKAERCKSTWLQHLALQYDMCTERAGTQLQPIPGLEGVEFMTDSLVTQLTSYVFGPVTSALCKLGYTKGLDLDAAPYDWRLPPSVVQERDRYLTTTIDRIEKMYHDNHQKPVALLCHSLGCRMGHYMLNHCLEVKGKEWIDKYIHAFICVGAPHLGVSCALRGIITGDKMGLDAFLEDEEGLILGRSLGSCPWLISTKLPPPVNATASSSTFESTDHNDIVVTAASIPHAICRKEATLTVTLASSTIYVRPLIQRRLRPLRVRLAVQYGSQILYSDYTKYRHKMKFEETFCFAVPPTFNQKDSLEHIVISLQEPGTHDATSREMPTFPECFGIWFFQPLRKTLCFPFSFLNCAAETAASAVVGGVMGAAGTSIASSPELSINRALKKTTVPTEEEGGGSDVYRGRIVIEFTAQADIEKPVLFRGIRRQEQTIARIQWTPPPDYTSTSGNIGEDVHRESALALLPETSRGDSIQDNSNGKSNVSVTPSLHVKDPGDARVEYEPASGHGLIQAEGMDTQILQLMRTRYERDPLGPRTKSSNDAPPIKRVISIYGINVPSECSAIYRRRPGQVFRDQVEQDSFSSQSIDAAALAGSKYILDTEARLEPGDGLSSKSYQVKGGIVYETKNTPQIINNMNNSTSGEKTATVQKSGDGTIPYWSLQQCRSWASPTCTVDVHEIDGADHRDILKDRRFHEILGDYLVTRKK